VWTETSRIRWVQQSSPRARSFRSLSPRNHARRTSDALLQERVLGSRERVADARTRRTADAVFALPFHYSLGLSVIAVNDRICTQGEAHDCRATEGSVPHADSRRLQPWELRRVE